MEFERQKLIEQFRRQRSQLQAIEEKLSKFKDDQSELQYERISELSSILPCTEPIIKQEKGNQQPKSSAILILGCDSLSPASSSISLTSTSNSIDTSQPLPSTTRFDSFLSPSENGNGCLNIVHNHTSIAGSIFANNSRSGNIIDVTSSKNSVLPLSPNTGNHLTSIGKSSLSNRCLGRYDTSKNIEQSTHLTRICHTSKN